jgi:carnitine O-acetyltransferase
VETLHYVSLGSDLPRRRVTGSGILSRRMESLCTPPFFFFFVCFSLNLCDSSCASSKHLQTRRFLDTLQAYFLDVQKLLIQLYRSANQRPAPFVDHLGILRDSKTGRPINGALSSGEESEEDGENEVALRKFLSYFVGFENLLIFFFFFFFRSAGYSFFDSGEVALLGRKKNSPFADIGMFISYFFLSF